MRKMRKFALAGVLALVLAACGSDEPAGGGQGQAGGGSTGGGQAPGYGAPPAAATVETGDTDLGTILTDAEGLTLYMFGADQDGESTCYDDCAATWPALGWIAELGAFQRARGEGGPRCVLRFADAPFLQEPHRGEA